MRFNPFDYQTPALAICDAAGEDGYAMCLDPEVHQWHSEVPRWELVAREMHRHRVIHETLRSAGMLP